MTNEEKKQLHKIITVAWNHLKEHSDVNGADEYWRKLVDDTEALSQEFRHPLLDDFLVAIASYLDKYWRDKNDKNQN